MNEKDVERYLCMVVRKQLGGRALKFVSPGLSGVPDRIVLLPGGRIYFVELKAPGKKLRKLQTRVCGMIRELGFTVMCIDSKDRVNDFVRSVKGDGV